MMVRSLILFLFFLSAFKVNGQQISGHVKEAITGKPIAYATVYFDGTFIATYTDSAGAFSLSTALSDNVPIVISSIGYISQKISGYPLNRQLSIELEPKVYQLNEVVVTDDGMSRAEKLQFFKREFFGALQPSRQATIENEDDIVLIFDNAKKTLDAYSDNPILINNRYLGYKIRYFLDNFTIIPGATAFDGNANFVDNFHISDLSRQVKRRRQKVFLNSRMHFIRSLWHNETDKASFKIYDSSGHRLRYNDLVVEQNLKKYIKLPTTIKIVRQGNVSYLSQKDDQTYSFIDKNGYYDASMLTWRGTMAEQRISELLPFEYNY